jgi:hypothetical protein
MNKLIQAFKPLLFLLPLWALLSCTTTTTGSLMNDTLYTLPKNCDFSTVGNNSSLSNQCSPRLVDEFFSDFQGILLNGPEKVIWPKDVDPADMIVAPNGNVDGPIKLMIAGFLKLPYNTVGLEGDLSTQVILVAVNQKTAQTFNGKMIRFGFTSKPELPGYGASQQGLDAQQYFNIDLVQNLEIPITNATYTVYATLGDYKSNVLTVQTIVK